MTSSSISCHDTPNAFSMELERWLADPEANGDNTKALREFQFSLHKRKLYLVGLQLNLFTRAIEHLGHLKELDLCNNKLVSFPVEIGALTQLKVLNLNSNNFTELPYGISRLTQLQNLRLWHNKVTALPSWIGNLSQLTRLVAASNLLTEIPPEIGKLTLLKRLLIDRNHLHTLPSQIGNLDGLDELDLWGCKMTILPREIGNLTRLTTLDLSCNKLTTLPAGIGELTRLRSLRLLRNNLISLPNEIGNLTQLYFLSCNTNNLTSLPFEIENLRSLECIDLRSNQLSILPCSLGRLINLRQIMVSGNTSLREIPLSFANLHLTVPIDNSHTGIPNEICATIGRSWVNARNSESLSQKLQLWQSYAGDIYDLSHILTYQNWEQRTIGIWLFRLTDTKDFQWRQSALASAACSMLESLKCSQEWRHTFISEVGANISDCGDRPGESFNILYVNYLLNTIDLNASIPEKLERIKGCAKTLVLREIIENLIYSRETRLNFPENESIEICLGAQIRLKRRLGLTIAVESMIFEGIGQCPWIDDDYLVNAVQNSYLSKMAHLEITRKIASTDPLFIEAWDSKNDEFIARQHELDAGPHSREYYLMSHNLGIERKEALQQTMIEWIEKHIS